MSSSPNNHNHSHTHSSLNATRDYMHASDHGELMNPQQSKTFVVDPLLTPVSVTGQPHPILPDPSPSDNPDMFDKSTRHPNSHYHPEAKLSKKKRAKKLGVGSIPSSRPPTQYAGGHTFTEHEKEAHERAERRDSQLAHSEEEYSEYSEEENNTEEQTSGTEKEGAAVPPMRGQKTEGMKRDEDEGEADKGEGDKSEKEEGQSLKDKATGLLSSAQTKATGMARGAMDAVRGAPVVGSLLNKVGLGGGQNKAKNSTREDMVQAKKEEEAA